MNRRDRHNCGDWNGGRSVFGRLGRRAVLQVVMVFLGAVEVAQRGNPQEIELVVIRGHHGLLFGHAFAQQRVEIDLQEIVG